MIRKLVNAAINMTLIKLVLNKISVRWISLSCSKKFSYEYRKCYKHLDTFA
jgi:hypothetical protein